MNLSKPASSPEVHTWFKSRRLHSTFSLKSPDFVPVAPQVAFSRMEQARIENNLIFSSTSSSSL